MCLTRLEAEAKSSAHLQSAGFHLRRARRLRHFHRCARVLDRATDADVGREEVGDVSADVHAHGRFRLADRNGAREGGGVERVGLRVFEVADDVVSLRSPSNSPVTVRG